MDSSQVSELIGTYLRGVVDKKAELLTSSLGGAKPKGTVNPFTGEVMRPKVSPAISRLADELAGRGLGNDSRFVTALAAALAEAAESPMRHLLTELQALQRNGDSGLDPEFTLATPHAETVEMDAVMRGFDRKRR